MDLLQREHPHFSRNRSGVWKNWLLAYKTGNISETVEDKAALRRKLILAAYIHAPVHLRTYLLTYTK